MTGSAVVTTKLSSVVMKSAIEVIAKAQSILALSLISLFRVVMSESSLDRCRVPVQIRIPITAPK